MVQEQLYMLQGNMVAFLADAEVNLLSSPEFVMSHVSGQQQTPLQTQQLFTLTLDWWIVDEKMNSPSMPGCSQRWTIQRHHHDNRFLHVVSKPYFGLVFFAVEPSLDFLFQKICFRVITLSLCIKILIMPAVYMLIVTWSKTFKWQTDSLRHTSFLITPFQHSLEGFITPPLATCLLTTILWELPPPEKQDIWLHENGERPAVQCPDYLVQDPVCIRVSMLKMRYLVTIRNACSLIYRHYGRTNSGIIDGRSCSRVDGSCRWTCS